MPPNPQVTKWSVSAVLGASGGTATQAAVAGKTHFLTGVYVTLDEDATITLAGPIGGDLAMLIDISAQGTTYFINGMDLPCDPATAVTGNVDTTTVAGFICIEGYTLP